MPRQNRVTPFGTLISTPARGTLMGNRGCLHDGHGRIRRPFVGKRWIVCLLEFRGRQRQVMRPGYYTELFFLDEATALAAGHRPCAECQHERYNLFRETWARANPEMAGSSRPAASLLDDWLHRERLAPETRPLHDTLDGLPDGVFVTDDEGAAYLVLDAQVLRWTPAGYEVPPIAENHYPLRLLTPPSIARTLDLGYPVGCIHPLFKPPGSARSRRSKEFMPTSIDPQPADDEIECANCGAYIYYELTRCPKCGVNLYEPEEQADPVRAPKAKSRPGLGARLEGFFRQLTGRPSPADELFGASIDQAELFNNLLLKVAGDRAAAERLIEFERRQYPGGNRFIWLEKAIQRWERDNQGPGVG